MGGRLRVGSGEWLRVGVGWGCVGGCGVVIDMMEWIMGSVY